MQSPPLHINAHQIHLARNGCRVVRHFQAADPALLRLQFSPGLLFAIKPAARTLLLSGVCTARKNVVLVITKATKINKLVT